MNLIHEIDDCLTREGYSFLKAEPEEAGVYYKYQNGVAQVVLGIHAHDGFFLSGEQLEAMKARLRELFLHPQGTLKGYPDGEIHEAEILTLILTGNIGKYRAYCIEHSGIWLYDITEHRLMIYENQPGDFYGLKEKLLAIPEQEAAHMMTERPAAGKLPVVSILFVAVNMLVFFILSLYGDTEDAAFMAAHGAMYPSFVLEDGEWYRMFTSMFLHFGIVHLMNNMVMLFFAGRYLEEAVGRFRYLVIYLLAGLGGNLISLFVMQHTNDVAVSAGASGAIFGVIGGLLCVAIINRGRFENLTTRGLVLMIALSLYYGFTSTGVDNWCHVGGLICGFVLTAALFPYKRRRGV